MKNLLMKYIQEKSPVTVHVIEIIDYVVKDVDDEDSVIGEDLKVDCVLIEDDDSGTVKLPKRVERSCLVNIGEFKRWRDKECSVRWQ